jgi:hypothetical protein
MDITVTFSNTGDSGIPDGAVLTFADASRCQVSTPRDTEQVPCADAGCPGCGAVHHRFTGMARLRLDASGDIGDGPAWKYPEPLYLIGTEMGVHGAPGLEVLRTIPQRTP